MQGKVEICGVNTARLKTLTPAQMDELLPKAKAVFKDTYARRPQLKLRGIQVVILDLISLEGAMSMGQLSSRVAIAKANTTPLVADLIEKGLLLRRRYEKDRRVVLIDLTE